MFEGEITADDTDDFQYQQLVAEHHLCKASEGVWHEPSIPDPKDAFLNKLLAVKLTAGPCLGEPSAAWLRDIKETAPGMKTSLAKYVESITSALHLSKTRYVLMEDACRVVKYADAEDEESASGTHTEVGEGGVYTKVMGVSDYTGDEYCISFLDPNGNPMSEEDVPEGATIRTNRVKKQQQQQTKGTTNEQTRTKKMPLSPNREQRHFLCLYFV